MPAAAGIPFFFSCFLKPSETVFQKTVRCLALLAFLGLTFTLQPAAAKESGATSLPTPQSAASGGAGPIDISADESLEWYKDQRLYVARGQARAVRGDSVVEADILTAHQREKAKGKDQGAAPDGAAGDIDIMTAEGNVKISDPKQQVFGDKAVYDLDQKIVKITGSNLKYVTEKDVVTARDSLEYYEEKNIAVARGHAVAAHQDSRIESDLLVAHFAPGANGQRELSFITAKGHVVIVTKDGGISRGDRGIYDAKKDTAELMDNVRITRGDTQLAGDRAEVEFATGQSRLLNDGSGRVRALLPSSGGGKSGAKNGAQQGKAKP